MRPSPDLGAAILDADRKFREHQAAIMAAAAEQERRNAAILRAFADHARQQDVLRARCLRALALARNPVRTYATGVI